METFESQLFKIIMFLAIVLVIVFVYKLMTKLLGVDAKEEKLEKEREKQEKEREKQEKAKKEALAKAKAARAGVTRTDNPISGTPEAPDLPQPHETKHLILQKTEPAADTAPEAAPKPEPIQTPQPKPAAEPVTPENASRPAVVRRRPQPGKGDDGHVQ